MFADATMGLSYARGLTRYLATPLDPAAIDEAIRAGLADRGASFLWVLEHAIFRQPASPYLPLLKTAGVELGDVVGLVHREGVESALEHLYRAGVWMSLEEFKGRRPLERQRLDLPLSPNDFDNPLLAGDFSLSSSGSRGPRQRMIIDLNLLAHEARVELAAAKTLEGLSRPVGMWRPVPPGSAGLKTALRRAKQGRPLRRWFSQQPISFLQGNARHSLLTVFTALTGIAFGGAIPWPRHVPLDEAWKVATWLAQQKTRDEPALLDANVSSSVRVCRAALERGLDIAGSSFRAGGEPFTPGKARVIADAGCRAFVHYSMAELGRIGLACAAPDALDDVHFLDDKLGLIQRPRPVSGGGSVEALFFTTLHPTSPKIMLNVDSGDYAQVTRRRCGCALGALGFGRHLQHIRSYDKLTSEGMHFVGDDLLAIVDAVLPARFGGNPTDYQFVEGEEDGLTRVDLIVSPRLGEIDERQMIALVLDTLAKGGPAQAMMANRWRLGDTLRVTRRDPYATSTAKILALHHASPHP